LAAILGSTFGYREAEALFGTLARDRGTIDAVIARLEKEIAANPRSADLHVALATAYGAKTAFGTPPGPEQGTVWAKAERAYDEAIRLDPEHWQARYGRAFGDSMAPEFVGLRPRAIRQFEELMEIQERKPAAPEQVEVYLRLGTLLKDAGNVKKARETWKRGLARFPDDRRIVEALALTEEK
jgi:tetratricopeptide (TPR) repeat protein